MAALRHFDTVIKMSQHCEQNRPCSSPLPAAEREAAVDALGEKGLAKSRLCAPKKKPGRALFGLLLPYPRRSGSRSPRMPHQRQEHDRFDDTVAD